jgi:predicted nuclease of restriction endonuclease-like (RecB) superfamily
MSRPKKSKSLPATSNEAPDEVAFAEVVAMIQDARGRALAAANTALVDLYWRLGEYIARKIESAAWGQGVVEALAAYIAHRHPSLNGFTRANLFRMRQFYDTYRGDEKVAPLVRQLPWSHNLLIMSRCKRPEEREFYLQMAQRDRWPRRELERQLAGSLFERVVLNPPRASASLKELHPGAEAIFRDAYLVEFLELPEGHREEDLHASLVRNLRGFLAELGRDFCFIGSKVPLQVGGKDFVLDLLFFHRGLNALVAIELKIGEFEPEHLGKLEFYLEALDRDVRKPHEGPSIGVLLCATKDSEVVEYALNRSLSPALVAEYQTRLPDKKLLQAKLHEFYALTGPESP